MATGIGDSLIWISVGLYYVFLESVPVFVPSSLSQYQSVFPLIWACISYSFEFVLVYIVLLEYVFSMVQTL